jgi:general secretion pathway protein E
MERGRTAYFLIMLILFVLGFMAFLTIAGYGDRLAPEWMTQVVEFKGWQISSGTVAWGVFGVGAIVFALLLIGQLLRKFRGRRSAGHEVTSQDLELPDSQPISALPAFSESLAQVLAAKAPSAPQLVNQMLRAGIALGASDIHLTPDVSAARASLRVHGVLYELTSIPAHLYPAVVSRIKVLSELQIFVKNRPQDGRIQMKSTGFGARVSVLPTNHGEKVVLRLASHDPSRYDIDALGMTSRVRDTLKAILNRNQGLIVLTGPTGSGKTTTMYASLLHIHATRGDETNIVTLEDPIEFDFPAFSQTQIESNRGLDFAAGLRSLLRQDPDVILMGEIRDTETADIGMRAAMTGHLLLTTVHADNAAGVFPRLIQIGVDPVHLASATAGVISQRLCRRLCPNCRREAPISGPQRQQLALMGIPEPPSGPFYEAVGCEKCVGKGFDGRMALYELLVVSPAIRDLIADRSASHRVHEQAQSEGMRTLLLDGLAKARAGIINLDEVLRVASA